MRSKASGVYVMKHCIDTRHVLLCYVRHTTCNIDVDVNYVDEEAEPRRSGICFICPGKSSLST